MKIFIVISTAKCTAMWVPQIHFISDNKEKCEEYIKNYEESHKFSSKKIIREIETDTDLDYLCSPVIW